MKEIIKFNQNITSIDLEKELGNKGYNLYKLYNEFNIPNGFILTSRLYKKFIDLSKQQFIKYIQKDIKYYLDYLSKQTNKLFGKDLKVSIRASGYYIMPGMMLTLLNINNITQILNGIIKIYQSYNSKAAKVYRHINNLTQQIGPAIIIQEMVYGDINQNSYTGVFTTRNIHSGQNNLYGECIHQACGQQLLSGLKSANKLQILPINLYNQIKNIAFKIENIYSAVQEVEFTIENNRIYILQCKQAVLTPFAKIKILYDFYLKNKISKKQILQHLTYQDYQIIQSAKQIDLINSQLQYICNGINISFQSITGKLILNDNNITSNSILYLDKLLPNYIDKAIQAIGVIATYGGATSHLSTILRNLNKTGLINANINKSINSIKINNKIIYENEYITIDGINGILYRGKSKFKQNSEYLIYLKYIEQLFQDNEI